MQDVTMIIFYYFLNRSVFDIRNSGHEQIEEIEGSCSMMYLILSVYFIVIAFPRAGLVLEVKTVIGIL